MILSLYFSLLSFFLSFFLSIFHFCHLLVILSYKLLKFHTIHVFVVRESIADISTELPCLGDLENPGRLPVQQVLGGTGDCVL